MLHEPAPVALRKIWGWVHGKVHPHRHKPKQALLKAVDLLYHPALRHHWEERYVKRHPRFAFGMLMVDLVLLFLVAGLVVSGIFGWFYLPKATKPPVVSLEMTVPEQVTSGGHTEIVLKYANDMGEVARCAVLILMPGTQFLPDGELPQTDISDCAAASFAAGRDENSVVIPLGDIVSHGGGQMTVPGRLFASSGSQTTITSELRYWQSGRTAPSVAVARAWTVFTGAQLALSFSSEAGAVYGRPTTLTFEYESRSDETLRDVVLRVEPPAGFRLLNVAPPSARPLEWRLGDLKNGDRGRVSATGWIFENSDAAPAFTATASTAERGRDIILESVRANADVRSTGFRLEHEVVKPANGNAALPGSEVTIAVHYRNSGAERIRDLRLSLLPTPAFGAALEPAELAWDSRSVPTLDSVEPGMSGTLTATIRLPEDLPAETVGADGHPELPIRAAAEYLIEGDSRPVRSDTAETVIPIATDLSVAAAGFYWTPDGEQLGVGPLPPRAGRTTSYRLILSVRNTTSTVRDAVVEAALPEGVSWTGHAAVTAGAAVDYLPSVRRIRWTLGNVSAFTDSLELRPAASIELDLTPTPAMIGRPAILLTGITVTGRDTATDTQLHGTAESVTTELTKDARAKGKAIIER